jgi:hypothetical protein
LGDVGGEVDDEEVNAKPVPANGRSVAAQSELDGDARTRAGADGDVDVDVEAVGDDARSLSGMVAGEAGRSP